MESGYRSGVARRDDSDCHVRRSLVRDRLLSPTSGVSTCQARRSFDLLRFPAFELVLDLPRAVHRGRYMKAVARTETSGVPIDMETLGMFRRHWLTIKQDLIDTIDRD